MQRGQPPVVRLCCLKPWADFSGYGFDLLEEDGRPRHLIGKVDEGSPGAASGLCEYDKIIEVNGINVEEKSHDEVVNLIKESPTGFKLLVVKDYEYFINNKMYIHGNMDDIKVIECPEHSVGKQLPRHQNINIGHNGAAT